MKAVRIHTFGGPEVMQVEEVPTTSPQAGQVLVRLAAAGQLTLRMEHNFALRDAAKAHTSLEGRQTTGKVRLIP